MLRRLIREFRDFPATMALGSLWVLVYLAMVLTDLWQGQVPSWRHLLLGSINGHRFGDMTVFELYHGEVWRTVTATFIHFGVVHLGMNLFGLFQLGTLVEEWYGAGQFLLLSVLIGGGGNALSGLIRHERGMNPYIHSGGGSTVLLGLVALCAVVGWRSKTRKGRYLQGQMVSVLAITALLGLLPFIDNWGHVGGALCGAVLGFGHRLWVGNAGRSRARWAGVLAVMVLGISAAAALNDDRAEGPERASQRRQGRERTLAALRQVERSYLLGTQTWRAGRVYFMPKQARGALRTALAALKGRERELDRRPTAGDFRQVRSLLEQARSRPPSAVETQVFLRHLRKLYDQVLTARNSTAIAPLRAARWPATPPAGAPGVPPAALAR